MSSHNRIAIISARGGSKRLPRKNILPLCGKPLISWTIIAAIKSGLFDKILVSTEDSEIYKIAQTEDVDVRIRPKSLSTDYATVADVCLYHLEELRQSGCQYKQLFCLYPTSPLRNEIDLRNISFILDSNTKVRSVIAVTKFSHYPHQALSLGKDGIIKPFWPELVSKRAKELPEFVAGNGSTYAIQVEDFLSNKDFYLTKGMYAYQMDFIRSLDVDTKEDFNLLEIIANQFLTKSNQ